MSLPLPLLPPVSAARRLYQSSSERIMLNWSLPPFMHLRCSARHDRLFLMHCAVVSIRASSSGHSNLLGCATCWLLGITVCCGEQGRS